MKTLHLEGIWTGKGETEKEARHQLICELETAVSLLRERPMASTEGPRATYRIKGEDQGSTMKPLREILAHRQTQPERHPSEDDDACTDGELIDAALCHAELAQSLKEEVEYIAASNTAITPTGYTTQWPFERRSWEPGRTPEENLKQAAGYLLAELERLNRSE